MPTRARPQLGHLIVTPFATIGVLAAVLMWEFEHVDSVSLLLAIAGGGLVVGTIVSRRLRADVDKLADHYEALLTTADDQSRQAEEASRVKDEFLATLSHELRTPLNAVLGWARLLATGKLDPAQTARAVQAIERAGWAQSRVIEDLLDISRIVTGKLEIEPRAVAVQRLVEGPVDALGPAAEAKDVAVRVSVDPAIEPVAVDPDRVQQVVFNLVSNAIKFTPSGGQVDVTLTAEEGHLCLTVRDTGIGFTPEVAAHLFERFRQGDSSPTRRYGGLGLGLGIVRHVVELHGGTVAASSAGDNTGSTFVVRLPMRRPDGQAVESPVSPAHAPSLRGVTVLAVDDDPEALSFVRATLERQGAVVVTAASAKEARARFTHEPPDVLISDLRMPDGDGLELIREIRTLDNAAGRLTPAAALSGLARTDDRRRALSAGYQMHLAKPIDPDELVAAVERLAQPLEGTAARRSA